MLHFLSISGIDGKTKIRVFNRIELHYDHYFKTLEKINQVFFFAGPVKNAEVKNHHQGHEIFHLVFKCIKLPLRPLFKTLLKQAN